MSERRFKVMDGGPSVPWRMVEPYEAQAVRNHDQTLEQLHKRGGLDARELWCVVHGKHWREMPSDIVALAWLEQWLAADIGARLDKAEARVAELENLLRCDACGGEGEHTFDVLRNGNEHDTETAECLTCRGTGSLAPTPSERVANLEYVAHTGRRLRDSWPESGCLVDPQCGACAWCAFDAALDALDDTAPIAAAVAP